MCSEVYLGLLWCRDYYDSVVAFSWVWLVVCGCSMVYWDWAGFS